MPRVLILGTRGEIVQDRIAWLRDSQTLMSLPLERVDGGCLGFLEGYHYHGIQVAEEWVYRNPTFAGPRNPPWPELPNHRISATVQRHDPVAVLPSAHPIQTQSATDGSGARVARVHDGRPAVLVMGTTAHGGCLRRQGDRTQPAAWCSCRPDTALATETGAPGSPPPERVPLPVAYLKNFSYLLSRDIVTRRRIVNFTSIVFY